MSATCCWLQDLLPPLCEIVSGDATGFEIETELIIHALEMRLPIAEVATPYRVRAEGSSSKLHTFRDGFRILRLIAQLVKEERPIQFFGLLGAVAAAIAIVLGTSVVIEFVETGLVPRLPTALLPQQAQCWPRCSPPSSQASFWNR